MYYFFLAFFEEQARKYYTSTLFSCAEINISDASVDALYFGSAILIDSIVMWKFPSHWRVEKTYVLRENIIIVRTWLIYFSLVSSHQEIWISSFWYLGVACYELLELFSRVCYVVSFFLKVYDNILPLRMRRDDIFF